MRVAHFGTFDVPNYGDLLFPGVIEHELGKFDDTCEITHISPLGGRPYEDVGTSISLETAKRRGLKFDGVVIGGGNILHAGSSGLPAYRSIRRHAYANIWTGAAQMASRQGIPLVVNAPGVPRRFRGPSLMALRSLGRQASYFAVRDTYSRGLLIEAGLAEVNVVPDTALRVSRWLNIIDESVYSAHPAELSDHAYIAVHVNDRYGGNSIGLVADRLDALSSSTGLRCCLIGIGGCHDDGLYAERVGAAMKSKPFVVAYPVRVRHIGALIAGSSLYVGSSLHGFITAASYSVPAIIVADPAKQHKLQGDVERAGMWRKPSYVLGGRCSGRVAGPVGRRSAD